MYEIHWKSLKMYAKLKIHIKSYKFNEKTLKHIKNIKKMKIIENVCKT